MRAMSDKLDKHLHVLIESSLADELDELAGKWKAFKRSHVVRVAIKLGVERLKEDPALLLQPED